MDKFQNPDRTTILQALKLAQCTASSQQIKQTKAHQTFIDNGIGWTIGTKTFAFDRAARDSIRQWLTSHGIDWRIDPAEYQGDYKHMASVSSLEKTGGQTVTKHWIPCVPLDDGVKINGVTLGPLPYGTHLTIDAATALLDELKGIVIIENLSLMTELAAIRSLPHFSSKGWLAVFRGSPQNPKGLKWAQRVTDQRNIPLVGFFDFDPAGLEMGLSSQCDALILPELSDIPGSAADQPEAKPWDFQNQYEQWLRVQTHPLATTTLSPWIKAMEALRAGMSQESMLSKHRQPQLIVQRIRKES